MAPKSETDDFASASLVALVLRAVSQTKPELLPSGFAMPDPMNAARFPVAHKRQLLEHIYEHGGAGPLLSVGHQLRQGQSPMLDVLVNSRDPQVLVEKWLRLERYGHSRNRTKITQHAAGYIQCSRFSVSGQPGIAENVVIAGFLLGIFKLAGAEEPEIHIDGARYGFDATSAVGGLKGDAADFAISWKSWQNGPDAENSPETGASTSEMLQVLISRDISRSWTLEAAARQLAKSTRSLQRELTGEQRTFSSVLRGTRLETAGRLLRDEKVTLAEVGYCCGYADQPHFQRDFRRGLNMSPGEYRRVSTL